MACTGAPGQPLISGVIVKVTVIAVLLLLCKVPLMFPFPLAAIPVTCSVLSRIQLNTVPGVFPDNTIVDIAASEHLVWLDGVAVTSGVGLTKTVAVAGLPGQPLAFAVTVNVTVTGFTEPLINVPEILPLPLLPIVPVMAGLSLTQSKVTPLVALESTMVVIFPPLQTC